MSVNIAPNQLRSATLPARVGAICAANGVPADALTLEITERVLLDDRPAYAAAWRSCRSSACAWRSTTSAPATPR